MKRAVAGFILASSFAFAQESQLGADFRREREHFQSSCGSFSFAQIGSCAQLLFTDHPLHIAVGSLAPGNGFGAGAAFVAHWTPNETWRLNWDADAVATGNGSWRAGGYMTAVLVRRPKITVGTGGPGSRPSRPGMREQPTFHAYVQNTSLNKVTYYGLGEGTSRDARSYFGEREAIVGGNVIWPLATPLNVSLFGEVNGRFVSIRPSQGQTSPSIEQLYTEATAPGLTTQPATAQFGEGIRARPAFAAGHVRLNYSFTFQQFAAADSRFSFRRITTDLDHQFPLYRTVRTYAAREFNGPDSCSSDVNTPKCPSVSRNLEGSFGFRFLLTDSFVPTGHAVPFYFAPTIGGADINGNPWLSSYPDYRFRAPNLMVLRESFEHSIYKWPIGATFIADQGRVAMHPGDLGFNHLIHSYAAGLTLRAGGLPVMYVLFAWGGNEGTHTIAQVSNTLLGGSARPPLY